jgi:transcriptional regulator with XRE-family HTH domain
MLLGLKMAMLQQRKRQTRMAVDLGWDPAKLSRIVNEITPPSVEDRRAICSYLKVAERDLFGADALRDGVRRLAGLDSETSGELATAPKRAGA